jgi:hypothetical protein
LLYPAELPGLGSRGFRQAFGFWGTCIIPHTFYAIIKKNFGKKFFTIYFII